MMKKIGNVLLCIVPFLMVLAVQVIGAAVYTLVYITATGSMTEDFGPMLAAIHFVNVAVSGLWYYFAFGRKGVVNPLRIFSIKTWGAVIALAVALQALIQFVLMILSELVPTWTETYAKLIEQSGAADLTVLSTIATVILAPIGEELAFRGLTYRYLRRAGVGIVLAHIIQALLFGIVHGWSLQAAYAMALGLVLGYLCEKYKTIYVPIVMHCLFNFAGTYGISMFKNVENMWPAGFGFLIGGSILLAAGIALLKADKKNRA